MEMPPVLAEGIGCSRIIPESKTRHIADCQRRGSEQTLENGQDLLSARLESAGWTHSLDGSFPGLLPTQPAHPSHGCSLFLFSPGNCSRISGSPWAGSIPWPGTEAAAPSRGLSPALRAGKQPKFPKKMRFLIVVSPPPAIQNSH